MADIRHTKIVWSRIHKPVCAVMAFALLSVAHTPSHAQSSDGVVVNLQALDDLDPMTTMPRLLMPSAQPTRGRIVLTPPPGVSAITPQRSRVTLRPPPGAPARVAPAPRIAVPTPAAAAPAPPVSVTAPPPAPEPAPEPPPVESSAAEETAEISPSESTLPAPAGPVADPMPAPEPPMAEEEAEEIQVASIPPATAENQPISISFDEEQTDLPSNAEGDLTDLADRMKSEEGLRVQLMAYASSADGSASSVRRTSLSRALSVREFLMDQGVQSTRIEVRALGDQNEGGNPNRVDAILDRR